MSAAGAQSELLHHMDITIHKQWQHLGLQMNIPAHSSDAEADTDEHFVYWFDIGRLFQSQYLNHSYMRLCYAAIIFIM